MQGIITLKAVNAETHEVEGEYECKNIISDNFIRNVSLGSQNLQLNIRLSTAVWKPTLYPAVMHTNNTAGFESLTRSGDVFGVSAWSFIDETQNTPAMLQYSARFAPPASASRTIKSVMLEGAGSYNTIVALTELGTPCVQTTSQYYDIYYRVIFDYADTPTGFRWVVYKKQIKNLLTSSFNGGRVGYYDSVNSFPKLNISTGDDVLIRTHVVNPDDIYLECNRVSALTAQLPISDKRNYALKNPNGSNYLNFTERTGYLFNSVYTRDGGVSTGEISASNVFRNRSKIQNIFGYAYESTNSNSEYFLDIDALATGSGSVQLTGDWENEETTANPALYFKKDFAKRISLEITQAGSVGVSSYKYKEQPFIRISNALDYITSGTVIVVKNKQMSEPIYGLLSETDITHFAHNKGVMGIISPDVYGPEQISAAMAYDDTSVLLPKKNEIILYSIPGSRYWRITGTFTNIHQIAVREGVVYIACRDTGLWSVNPRVSLTAQQVSVVGYRTADFSSCNGVAIGYGGKLWAVGVDALACLDTGGWTLYDSTTTNPFAPTNYSHINFLVVDFESIDDQMLCVYKSTANTKLGFWWSTTTSVVETANYVAHGYHDCKRNKGQIYGLQGHWLYNHVSYMTFGQTTTPVVKTAIPGVDGYDKGILTYSFIKNNGVWYRYVLDYYGGNTKVVNLDGSLNTIIETSSNGSWIGLRTDSGTQYGYSTVASDPTQSSNYDCQMSFMMSNGVLFTMFTAKKSTGKYTFRAGVMVAGLNNTPHGGTTRWICTKEYGWNGTNWELGHTGSKLTSNTPEPLLQGISVAFTDGAAGTSFAAGNFYKFGLAEGILKDNATRLSMKIPTFFTRTESGLAVLTTNTVPATASLQTGVVGIHPVFKSKDVFLDGSDRVTFPGNNFGQFAVGDKQVTGDFEISVSCGSIANSLTTNTFVGVGKHKRSDRPLVWLQFANTTTVYINTTDSTHYRIDDTSSVNGANWAISNFAVTASDTVGIKRVGTVMTITKNGVSVYTITASGIRAADKRLDVMFGIGRISNYDYLPANKFCGATTILTNGSDNAIKMGNEVLGTEAFDINCKEVVVDCPISGKLNGVTAPVIVTGALPSPGEISLDTDSMVLTFHPSDEGKTVEVDCTRVWNK